MTIGSALDHYRICMQKNRSLCADIYSSRAAEEASEKLWILIELSHDPQIICHYSGIPLPWPTFKASRGVCVCASDAMHHALK